MIFIGCKIIRKMSKHLLSYSFLIVELSIGILFFSYGMNFLFSGLEREHKLEKELGNNTFYLNAYSLGDGGENSGSDVTYDDYIRIVKLTEAEVDFMAIYDLTVESRGENIQTKVLYSEVNKEESVAFYGLGSEQILKDKADRIVSSLPVEMGKNRFIVNYNNQKKTYITNELNYDLQDRMLFTGPLMEDLKFGDCIILPLRDYQYTDVNSLHQNMLTLRFQKGENIEGELQKVCAYLQQQHGDDYRYEFKNIMAEYRDTKDSYLQVSQYISRVSVLMLLVLIIGYRGIMNVFLEQRKRELAICLAVGARGWQLILEYVGEVALICFMGIMTGLIMENILIKHSSSIAFPIRMQGATIMMCIGVALIIIISVLVTFIRFLFREQPLCGMRKEIL